MAHELSFTNGKADFFEVGEHVTAWHNEGTAIPVGSTLDDGLNTANMLYTVEKRPVYRLIPDGKLNAGFPMKCETGAVTVRVDRDVELGVVGADYAVVQNAQAFEPMRPLLDSGALRLETGGVLRDGADAWVLAQVSLTMFPAELRDKLLASAIAKYVLVRTNHNGRAKSSVTQTDIRVVCANTLGMVEAGNYLQQASIVHRGDASGRMDVAFSAILGGIVERTTDYIARYEALQALTLTEGEWQRRVMDVVQRNPEERADWDPQGPMSDATIRRYTEKRTLLHNLWREGRGHTGDGSAWEAYNGVAEAIDHNSDVFPVRGSRVKQLLPGARMYGIKDDVFTSLLSLTQNSAL